MVLESSLSSTGTTSDASPFPTSNAGPGILHPRSIATHVAALAQSMVSAPMLRASPGAWSQNRLWSCQSNSFECMRYGSAREFGLRHLAQRKPITEVEGQSIGNGTNEQCRSFTHVPSPTSTSLAQSMVSTPMVRAIQEHGLGIVSAVANQTASSACDMDRQVCCPICGQVPSWMC